MATFKYTDRQVAEDPELYGRIAKEYCESYTGSFHVLVEYRERLAAGYALNLPMVRTVLNCMLHDARVIDMPQPKYEPTSYGHRQGRRINFEDPFKEEEEDEVTPVYREQYVKMPVNWKHDYGMSSSPRAYVVHRIHPDSHALWSTETHEPKPVLWWRCKTGAWNMSRKVPVKLMSKEEAERLVASRKVIASINKCVTFCAACQVR